MRRRAVERPLLARGGPAGAPRRGVAAPLAAPLGLAFVPAVYALIYLTSVWSPGARTQALPALVVNADRGADFMGRPVKLGDELVRRLRERPTFGYQRVDDERAARRAVTEGRAQFALLMAAYVGRWKRVPVEDYRPALDID